MQHAAQDSRLLMVYARAESALYLHHRFCVWVEEWDSSRCPMLCPASLMASRFVESKYLRALLNPLNKLLFGLRPARACAEKVFVFQPL